MIVPPVGARIWIAAGMTDMRRGFPALSAQVQASSVANRPGVSYQDARGLQSSNRNSHFPAEPAQLHRVGAPHWPCSPYTRRNEKAGPGSGVFVI